MNYQDLINDHDEIDAIAARLEHAVERQEQPPPSLDDLLGRLAQVVADHLAKEDGFIYPDLSGCRDPGGATGLVLDFEALKQDWETYLAAWRHGLAARDWPGFRQSTLGMLHRLRERVMKETALLYSMALREGLITMRGAA